MRIGYIRSDARMGEAPQRQVLEASGIPVSDIYVETNDHAQPRLNWIIEKKMRRSQLDTVEVSDYHRLCSNSEGMANAVARIAEKNGVAVELRTGARSDNPGPFAKAFQESVAFLSGKLSRADRVRISKLGAAASPVTKPRPGHMPFVDVNTIVNDVSLSFTEAIMKINCDKRYKRKVNPSLIRRWHKQGHIHLPWRVSGPRPKA